MANDRTRPADGGIRARRDRRLAGAGAAIAAVVVGAGVVLLLLVALLYYWIDWTLARPPYTDDPETAYSEAARRFWEDVEAGRLDAAYDATSAGFRARVSREAFAKL